MTPQRKIERIMQQMQTAPRSVSFRDLEVVCQHYFGSPRVTTGSHRVYATPWPGDPRVNIQNDHGSAKSYQVRQVLAAIDQLVKADNIEETDDDA